MLCKLSWACSFTLQRCRFPQLLKRTGPRGTEGRQRSERGLNMSTKTFTLAAALSLALIFPASSLARNTVYTYWYQPHYMAKVDDAYNSLQFMPPHFVPGNQYAMPNPPPPGSGRGAKPLDGILHQCMGRTAWLRPSVCLRIFRRRCHAELFSPCCVTFCIPLARSPRIRE